MLLGFLFSLDVTWFITAAIALLTYVAVSHWLLIRRFPPGPTPLPIIGNALTLQKKEVSFEKLFEKWRKMYGELFTIWIGRRPMIIACGWDIVRDGLVVKRNDFSGRTQSLSGDVFRGGHDDVILSDFGPSWEALRKIAHSAVRKYADTEKLAVLVQDVVDQCLKCMWEETNPVDMHLYSYLALYNILATTAFGERYDIHDKEFLELKAANDNINEEFSQGLPSDIFPCLRYLFYHKERKLGRLSKLFRDNITTKYEKHKREYTPGVVRDFTDAVLLAKEEAEKEDSENAVHLKDGNLVMVLYDLFIAGTDTTRNAFLFVLLYLANDPEMQEKVRREILDNIGDRLPVQEDKRNCHFTVAVITELLRIRPVVSMTLEHKAICDVEYGGFHIPKDTGIMFNIHGPQNDENLWSDPESFKPERFLDEEGKFTTERVPGYFPFGLGRRSCPGEKLAKADLFLMLAGFLRKCRFSLPNGPGSADLQPQDMFLFNFPRTTELIIEKV